MNKLIIFALCLWMTSCISIPGFNTGYKRVSQENRQKIEYLGDRKIDSIKNDGHVYKVNAGQLLDYIRSKERVLVYDWSPRCGAESCVTLDYLEKFCRERGLELVVVMEYYEFDELPAPTLFSKPVLFIDNQYYGTNYCHKYTQRFFRELSGKSFKELNYGRHFYFANGRFEGMYDSDVIKANNSTADQRMK